MENKVIEDYSTIEIPVVSSKSEIGKTLDEIDTIELAISEIVNQAESKLEVSSNVKLEEVSSDRSLIVIEARNEETEADDKARVALQQLESINSSSRRRKKHEIGTVVCTKKLQASALDNSDLIAILQGTDDISSGNGTANIKEEVLIEVEGEGHFEVLDIVENEEDKLKAAEPSSSPLPQKNRKRKQDFKSDLVSSIASEWSEEDDTEISKIDKSEEEAVKCESLDSKIPEITPFKRTRVIKRKIIWDPDAPETQFSYASLIQPKNKISPNQTKELNKKRVTSPVRRKLASPNEKKTETSEKKIKNAVSTKKKKLTEIDRLLGDEGAANMLNSLEQQAELSTVFENKNKRAASSSKSKPSENWDFVYNSKCVDSMIARRRSTSSYSSTTSPHRNSFDATPPNFLRAKNGKNNDTKKRSSKNFEFARPEDKKTSKKDDNCDDGIQDYNIVNEIKKSVEKKKTHESFKPKESGIKARKESDNVLVKRIGSVYNVSVDTKNSKSRNMFTLKMLNKITEIFTDLSGDDECKVVLFSSTGQHFCQGLDFTDLVNSTDKSSKSCHEWTKSISELFQTFLKFPKPLIGAVQGNVSGLGVMLIPLFDITICSDKCSFEASYIKSGQFPEGYSLFDAIIDKNLVNRLIWLGEKINSSEAISYGFITKSTAHQKTFEESLSYAKKMSTYSQDVYKNMKKLRYINIGVNKLLDQLKEDEVTLSKSLISNTFCENYKHFIPKGSC